VISETVDLLANDSALAQSKIPEAPDFALQTAKSIARDITKPVIVIAPGLVPYATLEHSFGRVKPGYKGKIMNDLGTYYLIQVQSTGLVKVTKDRFSKLFRMLSNNELVFGNTDERCL
jgi:hypothetical protein